MAFLHEQLQISQLAAIPVMIFGIYLEAETVVY
jgi:hypothetical protein